MWVRVLLAIGALSPAWACTARREPEPQAAATEWIRVPARVVRDVDAFEARTSEVTQAVRAGFLQGLRAKDRAALERALTADFETDFPDLDALPRVPDPWVDLRHGAGTGTPLGRARALERFEASFGRWTSIDRVSWRVYGSTVAADPERRVLQLAHFDVAGLDPAGRRARLATSVRAELVGDGSGWKLRRLGVLDASLAATSAAPFADLTNLVGFDHHLGRATRAGLQRMIDEREMVATGGLTALDFNADGFWDLIASHQAKGSTLFLNDGQGGFVRGALPLVERPEDAGKFYLYVDLDNDGREELVSTRPALYRFGPRMEQVDTLKFESAVDAPNFEGMTACDLDRDGLLDLVFSGYSHAASERGFNNVDSHNGVQNLIFMNQGKLRFVERGRELGVVGTRYSFVGECFDFDRDGDPDLFFGNDYGPNEYFENVGGRFEARPQHPLATGTSFSMGVSIADYDNEGELSVSISNMYSHSGTRIVPLAEGLSAPMQATLARLANGNSLYRHAGGRFVEEGEARGVNLAEWAWANQFFDLDNDGDKDLYAVNGYTTHQDPAAPDF